MLFAIVASPTKKANILPSEINTKNMVIPYKIYVNSLSGFFICSILKSFSMSLISPLSKYIC